ncbi:hypothetical protein [Arthrobacter sp. B1805]|uniref:hypothetical protein n=1 Tax=Arthrobacter sp. B1805 TaxID=2058892 RepID=UPI0015E43261|nr:hypothetical protein [Arthrobacter sp. B1805]
MPVDVVAYQPHALDAVDAARTRSPSAAICDLPAFFTQMAAGFRVLKVIGRCCGLKR